MSAEQKGPRGFQMADDEPKSAASLPPMTFGAFVLMLATSAQVHMGEAVAPGAEAPSEVDLELAQQTIDILEMLEAKTQGNLDEEERHLLQSVLHDLRMRFVELRSGKPD
jgi:hypothetical protein